MTTGPLSRGMQGRHKRPARTGESSSGKPVDASKQNAPASLCIVQQTIACEDVAENSLAISSLVDAHALFTVVEIDKWCERRRRQPPPTRFEMGITP